ncbi:MAG TPA: hypothetical protein VEY71_10415 [Chitinophagales bacterium]|nr:hypothetical protein [Chitinophagales bacterium]
MKNLSLLAVLFIVLSSFSCKKGNNVDATVVRDCTGTYLRINTSDYRVCNKSKLSKFEDGETVNVTFRVVTAGKCEADEDIVCMMAHEYKDRIVVTKVD